MERDALLREIEGMLKQNSDTIKRLLVYASETSKTEMKSWFEDEVVQRIDDLAENNMSTQERLWRMQQQIEVLKARIERLEGKA